MAAFSPPAPTDIVSGGFTPPAPEDVIDAPAPAALSLKIQPSIGVNQPSEFSSGLGRTVPPELNPDYDFSRATGGGIGLITRPIGNAIGKVSEKVIEPAAAALLNALGSGGESGSPMEDPQFKAGEPIIPDPLAGKKGILPAITRTVSGLSTPGNVVTLPFAIESKPIQAAFLAQTASQFPDEIQNLATAQSSDELKDSAATLGINLAFAGLLSKGLKDGSLKKPISKEKPTEGGSDASKIEEAIQVPSGQPPVTPEKVAEGSPAQVQPTSNSPQEQVTPPPKGAVTPENAPAELTKQKSNVQSDFERYTQLSEQALQSIKNGQFPDKDMLQEIENIKNKHGGMPPPSNPDIKSTDLETPSEPEPELEFQESQAVDPQSGSPIEKENASPEQAGGKSPITAPKINQESTEAIKPQGTAPVNPSNASPRAAGIAARVLKQRSDAGLSEPIPAGKGNAPEASVERGRQLLPNSDPEKIVSDFEKTGRFSSDDVAIARARLEQLQRATNQAEDSHGKDSQQFKDAYKSESDWAGRTKKIQTEWAKSGAAQQGTTDIDTGSFSGLKRAYRDLHDGKELPKVDEKQAQDLADQNKKLSDERADLLKKVSDAIENETTPKIELHIKLVADKLKGFFDTRAKSALERITARRAAGRLFIGIDPTELGDYANYGASKILAKGIEGAEMTAEWAHEMADELGEYIKPHLKQIWDASKQTFEEGFKKIAGIGEVAKKARKASTKTDAEILEQRKASLEKQIAEKENKIKTGDVAKKLKPSEITSPEIEALKETSAQLDAQIRLILDPIKFDAQEKAAKAAKSAADKTVREAAARAADAENDERAQTQKLKTAEQNVQIEAADKARSIADKTVRTNAAKSAKESAQRGVLEAKRKKDLAGVQLKAAENARKIADRVVRSAAIARAKEEVKARIAAASKKQVLGTFEHTRTEFLRYKGGKMDADQVRALWQYVKKNYIDKGNADFGDIVKKVATDLGLSFKDVANGLAQSKSVKKLTDELWRKQTDARRVSESAKRFVRQTDSPFLGQAIPSAARKLFGLKTFAHGGVAFGTHAPMVAFMPKHWSNYFRDFGKMHKMVFSPARYEAEVQGLRADKNFDVAQRAGLVNDPYKVEDFNNPDMAQYFGRLSGAGNRGYFALKLLRQDMFNQGWEKLPESIKTPEMAKAMADDINHITGVVKGGGNPKASIALFAPKLLMSRFAFMAGDPYKAAEIMSTALTPARWKALPPEQKFAVVNQVKQKATILATAYGLLLANQALLNSVGSKQKVNLTDPTKSDFWKFKAAGMDFSFGNAMLNMARLPVRLWTIGEGDGGKLKHVIYPDESMTKAVEEYARSQLSPLATIGADFVFKGDYQNRPLPQIPGYGKPIPLPKRLEAQGIKPYTWKEYFAEQASPLPLEEAEREVWRQGFGTSPQQEKSMLMAAGTLAVMMATGGRLTEDIQPKTAQPTSRFKQ